jgi:hypothetical protein
MFHEEKELMKKRIAFGPPLFSLTALWAYLII